MKWSLSKTATMMNMMMNKSVMGKDDLLLMITRLRILVIAICMFNFTACSAKNKATLVTKGFEERAATIDRLRSETNEAKRIEVDSSTFNQTQNRFGVNFVTDSIKHKSVVNRRGIEKVDIKIDSISSNDSKIYGITISERSSATINLDETTDIFGLDELIDRYERQENKIDLVRTDEMSKQEKIKTSVEETRNSKSDLSTNSSEKETPWLIIVITMLLSRWWFWLGLVIAGYFIYKRITGVDPFLILISKVKSWFTKD